MVRTAPLWGQLHLVFYIEVWAELVHPPVTSVEGTQACAPIIVHQLRHLRLVLSLVRLRLLLALLLLHGQSLLECTLVRRHQRDGAERVLAQEIDHVTHPAEHHKQINHFR